MAEVSMLIKTDKPNRSEAGCWSFITLVIQTSDHLDKGNAIWLHFHSYGTNFLDTCLWMQRLNIKWGSLEQTFIYSFIAWYALFQTNKQSPCLQMFLFCHRSGTNFPCPHLHPSNHLKTTFFMCLLLVGSEVKDSTGVLETESLLKLSYRNKRKWKQNLYSDDYFSVGLL